MLRANLSFLTLTFLFITGACDPKGGETDSATGSASTTTGDSTTDASTTGDSTTDESPTSSATTDDGATTENDEPTVATTGEDTGDTTGPVGPVDPAHQSACEAACQRFGECEPETDGAECVLGCLGEFQGLPSECVALNLAVVQCIPELSCPEIAGEIEETPCDDELEALIACDGGGDECTQSIHEGEGECGVSTSCPDAPTQEFICDADTCVCTVDGVEVAQCPADGVCAEGDAIFDKMHSCCNFE
ncbi:hypothetical protein SAMN02745121_05307 [Nannocystis exedens]|uniref:Uncharacterized protein n=1 Tax=Nannocystis exedens TaxID=54 RepID=A0A1I2CWT4_9BACT|nr:hypothetical protein [Nannocystis exedens]PCC68633.1 hypothetical protein NAEX_01649 [Nannocystis exedens]SFE72748.1 hypothetical protein SAMN02745121_05307 [Nannocystis exedens]